MATLHLIRHGQASFGKANYDQLSQTGWKQGRVLGEWLSRHLQPDAVFHGDLQRHRETYEAMAEGFGPEWPGLNAVDPGLNEFDHLAVIHAYRPEWADRNAMARDLAAEGHPGKAFQKAFTRAVERWVAGRHDEEYEEPWSQFRERVWAGIERILDQSNGAKNVVAVTSGGPITVVIQRLLELSDRRALGLNEVLANASVSRMLFSGERRSLGSFNSYAHLEGEDPALVTFR